MSQVCALYKVKYIQLFQRKTHPPIPQQFVICGWKLRDYESKYVILRPCAERLW